MNVMILEPEAARAVMGRLAGVTPADDLRTLIVQSETRIFNALRYHHETKPGSLLAGPWWQNVMADSLQSAEAAMVGAEAELRQMGEPRSTWKQDRARAEAGFYPYTGRMADFMAAHGAAHA